MALGEPSNGEFLWEGRESISGHHRPDMFTGEGQTHAEHGDPVLVDDRRASVLSQALAYALTQHRLDIVHGIHRFEQRGRVDRSEDQVLRGFVDGNGHARRRAVFLQRDAPRLSLHQAPQKSHRETYGVSPCGPRRSGERDRSP